jgi:hypothetical protein
VPPGFGGCFKKDGDWRQQALWKMWEKRSVFCGAFSKHLVGMIKKKLAEGPPYPISTGAPFPTARRARRFFEICGKGIEEHAISATN